MPTSHAKVIKTKENHNLQTKIYHHTLIKKTTPRVSAESMMRLSRAKCSKKKKGCRLDNPIFT